ncbi:MAG: uL22 family ribosomal protein [Candidatus Aenigmarchaeota archaeon]|nr:uL22 family ribosomal protein [Candidatus Aenigmarchaeota archaeon]
MKTASARLDNARVSLKHSVAICKELKNKKLEKAKKFLENLRDKKISLNKKYYTKASKQILKILENAEANARVKNLNPERLFVKSAKADKGEVFIRPKSRWRFRGRRAKVTRIEIELEER